MWPKIFFKMKISILVLFQQNMWRGLHQIHYKKCSDSGGPLFVVNLVKPPSHILLKKVLKLIFSLKKIFWVTLKFITHNLTKNQVHRTRFTTLIKSHKFWEIFKFWEIAWWISRSLIDFFTGFQDFLKKQVRIFENFGFVTNFNIL